MKNPNKLEREKMLVMPAIDIMNGQCVRLRQGDFNQLKVYDLDPVAKACKFEEQGARYLHIVDLDGARRGTIGLEMIKSILSAVSIPVQIGGGVRSLETAGQLISMGADRIVLATVALEKPDILRDAIDRFGSDRIALALDTRAGRLVTDGWLQESPFTIGAVISQFLEYGTRWFILTDTSRDGTLSGPNFELAQDLLSVFQLNLLLAGGISRLDHLVKAEEMGMRGVIVGKAIYEGRLNLEQVLAI